MQNAYHGYMSQLVHGTSTTPYVVNVVTTEVSWQLKKR